jgi:hypothetical protein
MRKHFGLPAATWWVIAVSAVYWICAGLRAAYRPFGYDELVTWYVARLPNFNAMWTAVASGVDSQLPLMHLTVRAAHWFFGYSSLATRFPMLIGFWVMQICIYMFLKRRLTWPYAVMGMVFPALTFAWHYAFEARAYGIILGCAGVVLAAWQSAVEDRWRIWSMAAMAAGLAVVLACHSTAAVIGIPVAVGELVRTWERRSVDWGIWLAFAAPIPVALMYPPLLGQVLSVDLHGLQPHLFAVSTFYAEAFKGAITPLLAAGLAAAWLPRSRKDEPGEQSAVPRWEIAALAGFVLIPLPFFTAGLFSSHFIFFPRYAVTCVTGVAGLVAIAWHLASRGGRRAGIAALVMLTGWLALARGKEALALARDPGSQFRDDHAALVSALSEGKPVAIWNINTFLEADFYLRGNELSYLNYVVPEREIGRRYLWQDFNSHVAPLLGTIAPLRARVIPWREFEQTDAFLLHEEGTPSWWYEALPEQGWERTLKLHLGEEYVWEVSRAARQARR